MKKQTFATHIFNFRLFIEGLKRLRVTTMALGIVTVAISALVPIVAFMNARPSYDGNGNLLITEIKFQTVCVPASLAVLLGPIFFLVLFSFLHKRKQSDFFHAIPYTRTCVYISFVAAALVSVSAIQLVSGVVAGLLWGMVPYTTYEVGPYIALTISNLLGSFMLSAFMMLTLTVSGTGGSSYVLFLLFASLPRIVMAFIATFIQEVYVLNVGYWLNDSPLSPLWFYPLSSIASSVSGTESIEKFLFNPATIVYSIVISLLIFAAAGFLYNRRHSEMAGNPAPGKKTQALFRILFALPMALLLITMIALDADDASFLLIILVITALCYFLYELVTTKRAANMAKAIPGFFLLLGISIVFVIVAYFSPRAYVRLEDMSPAKLEAVTVPKRLLTSEAYGGYQETVVVEDPAIIAILSEAYSRTVENGQFAQEPSNRYEVTFEKKGGRELPRKILLTQQERKDIAKLYLVGLEKLDNAILNPLDVTMVNIDVVFDGKQYAQINSFASHNETTLLMILNEEFRALSSEEQQAVLLSPDFDTGEPGIRLMLYTKWESTRCLVDERLPQTRRYILGLFTDFSQSKLVVNDETSTEEKSVSDILSRTVNILHSDRFSSDISNFTFEIQAKAYETDDNITSIYQFSGRELADILQFLNEHQVFADVSTDDIASSFKPEMGEKYEIWYLHAEYTLIYDSLDYRMDASVNMAIALNQEDMKTFRKLLQLK